KPHVSNPISSPHLPFPSQPANPPSRQPPGRRRGAHAPALSPRQPSRLRASPVAASRSARTGAAAGPPPDASPSSGHPSPITCAAPAGNSQQGAGCLQPSPRRHSVPPARLHCRRCRADHSTLLQSTSTAPPANEATKSRRFETLREKKAPTDKDIINHFQNIKKRKVIL
uniref:Uncharacterized protein n=1 Tax=Oryza glumipatula TaxID=40148 RepID=A0A0E0BSR2_9ORYZ